MYLTFKQALNRISPGKEYKNETYYQTRILGLIKSGELTEGHPETVYVKDENGNEHVLKVKIERLVTAESVTRYIENRNRSVSRHGCVTKGGKPVIATFSDGTTSRFANIDLVCRFFNLSRYKLRVAIAQNRAIEYPINSRRCSELGVEHENEISEHVKFKYD